MTTNDLIFTNNVYELRKKYGISQEKMATDLNIGRRTIGKIENGSQNPSLEMVYRISAYFMLQIPEIFPLFENVHLASFQEFTEKEGS